MIPVSEFVFKYRIQYNIQKGQMLYKIFNNAKTNIQSPGVAKKGWVRLKSHSSTEVNFVAEKFLVKTKEDNRGYDHELKEESLIEQMKNLKKIIEISECDNGSYNFIEIVADFIQEHTKKWYFLNVVNYKLEFVIVKKPSSSVPRFRKIIKPIPFKIKITDKMESPQEKKSEIDKTLSTKELLTEELIKELESPKINDLTSEEIYRKAYHLKSRLSRKNIWVTYIKPISNWYFFHCPT